MFISFILFLFFIIFGACIGSFITMASYRLPKKEEIVFKSSYCPKCENELEIKSLIPLVSFIRQKGRCLKCGEKISPRYFIIELINTLVYALLFCLFGFSFTCFYLCFLFSFLLLITVIDFEHYEIPLYTQIPLLFFAIVHILANPINPLYAIFCAFVYLLIIEVVRIITEKIKKTEVLGGGDTKLIILCGIFLGLNNLGLFMLITGISGVLFSLIWKKIMKKNIFPFAPSILFSMFILLVRFYYV